MRWVQYLGNGDRPCVGLVEGADVVGIDGFGSLHELAQAAIADGWSLDALAARADRAAPVRYAELIAERRLLTPFAHPDPARCLVSGTGLTHLGSAATRDAMHQKLAGDEAQLSDSMRMFKWGMEGGRPEGGQPGVQPEWFYKGDGAIVVAPGAPLPSPSFALDGGEEPELVGIYLIAADGTPCRIGFAIGNEFSDHVTERKNYLYLAHSKLRACAIGPELRSGPLPADLRGFSRVRRGGELLWEKPFATGEANMCHTLANLEYHHFKYPEHRRPGDVHLHFFGTATLSFADGIQVQPGDTFEIDLPELGAPLVNPLARSESRYALDAVRVL